MVSPWSNRFFVQRSSPYSLRTAAGLQTSAGSLSSTAALAIFPSGGGMLLSVSMYPLESDKPASSAGKNFPDSRLFANHASSSPASLANHARDLGWVTVPCRTPTSLADLGLFFD